MQALAYGVFYALTAATAILGLHFLQRRRRRFELAAAQQEKADRLFAALLRPAFCGHGHHLAETKQWLQFNDLLCEMLGYSREELATKTWAELTHPEDLVRDIAAFEGILRGKYEGLRAGQALHSQGWRRGVRYHQGQVHAECRRLGGIPGGHGAGHYRSQAQGRRVSHHHSDIDRRLLDH